MTEVELAGKVRGRGADAGLSRCVVEDQVNVAAAVERRRVQPGDDAGVIEIRIDTGREGRPVFAVVELTDDDRAIRVALLEVDQHFVADPRQEDFAVVRAGERLGDAQPVARLFRSRVAGAGFQAIRGASATALFEPRPGHPWPGVRVRSEPCSPSAASHPVKLHFHFVVARGREHLPFGADQERGVQAGILRRGGRFGNDHGIRRQGDEFVLVQRLIVDRC